MKKLIKFLSVLICIALVIAGFIFYGTFVSVKRVNIVNSTVLSSKIPDDCNNLKIALISDLHYGTYMNAERFSNMIKTLNKANPDVVLFAGDLFDKPSSNMPSETTRTEVIDLLKSIKAPYGKFAVLGESDYESKQLKDLLYNIYYYSDFELLENSNVLLRKNGSSSINLVGLDSSIGGNPDINKAMLNLDTNNFTLVLTHAPDITSELITKGHADLVLAGHSHGGQIALPFFGPFLRKEGATRYNHGMYTINNTTLLVSNGLGTSDYDIRLFAPPQINMIRLTNGK